MKFVIFAKFCMVKLELWAKIFQVGPYLPKKRINKKRKDEKSVIVNYSRVKVAADITFLLVLSVVCYLLIEAVSDCYLNLTHFLSSESFSKLNIFIHLETVKLENSDVD